MNEHDMAVIKETMVELRKLRAKWSYRQCMARTDSWLKKALAEEAARKENRS